MFKQASKIKLRFVTPKGGLSVEDLWDLPLTGKPGTANLDDIAKALYKELREDVAVSFVNTGAKREDTLTSMQFDLIRHIIDERLLENKKKDQDAVNRAKKERILAIMAEKEDDSLKGASMAELKRMLADL